ncbi:hypothetical protein [Peterkaempfera sp. SMS 1(5)a]|uniref:hypothetical protein n=1 Tax=Peterkaempfera podocarpi TaxID=3232308 RepID=UPI00366E55FA
MAPAVGRAEAVAVAVGRWLGFAGWEALADAEAAVADGGGGAIETVAVTVAKAVVREMTSGGTPRGSVPSAAALLLEGTRVTMVVAAVAAMTTTAAVALTAGN